MKIELTASEADLLEKILDNAYYSYRSPEDYKAIENMAIKLCAAAQDSINAEIVAAEKMADDAVEHLEKLKDHFRGREIN